MVLCEGVGCEGKEIIDCRGLGRLAPSGGVVGRAKKTRAAVPLYLGEDVLFYYIEEL